MASRRQLKKKISYVCGELAAEILLASHVLDNIDRATVNRIVSEIAALQVNSRGMVTVAFDKVPRDFDDLHAYNRARRAYYKQAFASLRKEFGEKVLALVKEMNAAVPADERNKLAGI